MGIAWLGNVLFFSKELLFIAYIMTVFIAAQGIIIVFLYVLLSKHVKEMFFIATSNVNLFIGKDSIL